MPLTGLHPMIYLQAGILLAALLGVYFPFLLPMVQDWSTNDNYSHGYFIPFIAAYMIYARREEFRETVLAPSSWGLALIALGLAQLLVGKIGSEFFLQRTSLIVVLFGMALFLCGTRFTKKIGAPLLYLIFMVPLPAVLWSKFAFPMQLFASGITEQVVQAVGIPVFREGNVLHLTDTSLEVVDACSGLRSLVSMFALSAALAYLSPNSMPRKWLVFLAAVPIAVLVNVVRLTLTAVLANRFGGEMAQGFLHDFSGWLVFVLGIALLLGVNALLGGGGKRKVA